MMRNITALILIFFVNFVFSDNCKELYEKSAIMRIKRYVFCGYDSGEPPSSVNKNGTIVGFGLLPRIAHFDETTDNLEIHTLVYFSWTDERLIWNATLFDNVTSFFVPVWKLWGPEIVVHSPGGGDAQHHGGLYCHLHSTEGTVTCIPTVVFNTRCQTDFTLWPYDRQNCTLVISSTDYSGSEITYRDKMTLPVHMGYFVSNGEWRIVVSRAAYDKRLSHYFPNMTTPTISIDFILDRIHNQMSIIYVSPGIILVIMTLTTIWLDSRSTERLSLACLNLVIHVLCVQNIHWALPHNGPTVPYILLFYINSYILAIIALLLTFLLRKIQNLQNSPPKWISVLTAMILRSKIGQILLLSILDPKASAGIEYEADDNSDLVNTSRKEPAWGYVTILLGWISFISFFISYLVMYSYFMPKSSMKPPIEAIELFM